MLKLTLQPGEYLDIGENIRVVFTGGSARNAHLMIDAPKEVSESAVMPEAENSPRIPITLIKEFLRKLRKKLSESSCGRKRRAKGAIGKWGNNVCRRTCLLYMDAA